jgi:hypothetical protein
VTVTTLRCGAPPETSDDVAPQWLSCVAQAPDPGAIARLAAAALRRPLGLPPLEQCVTPGDRVAIAVGHGTPSAGAVVSGIVEALASAGIERHRVKVVAASPRDAAPLRSALAETLVEVETHDPVGEDSLCFAGLAKGDRPLLVNRTVFEADVVLPLAAEEAGATPVSATEGCAYDGLFPDFFDQHTIDRFRRVRTVNDAALGGGARKSSRRAEADRAGWLVGAPLVLRAVPGPGGGVAAVVAGEPEQVVAEAGAASRRAWRTPLVEAADVVLAVVSGGADQQTWDSIGRALEAADRLVTPGGVIAVWSEVAEPVAGELARLAEGEDPDELGTQLAAESGDSALAAWRVLQAVERGPVFLHSRLEADEVESIGLAPVASADEMLRLLGRFDRCTVLSEAQHVQFESSAETPS